MIQGYYNAQHISVVSQDLHGNLTLKYLLIYSLVAATENNRRG